MSSCKSGIYLIENLKNGKIYVGSAYNLSNRISTHKYALRNNKHKNKHLQSAFNIYGEENFSFSILEIVEDLSVLLEREQFYIDFYRVYDKNIGYNMAKTAGNTAGVTASKETRKRQSESAKRRPKRKLTNQHKKRLSERFSGLGHKVTWEQVGEIRKQYCENNISQKELAKKYGIAQTTVSEIIRNVIWKDLKYTYKRKRNKRNA